jgi:transposase InsO family protein
MYQIHPNARTIPAVHAALAASTEPTGVLAQRYGISPETVRKWRKRGAADCQDHSARPHRLRWRASDAERAVVCAVRRATRFPLDDLTFTLRHFLPNLNRDSIYRILKAEGLGRLPPPPVTAPKKGTSKFKDDDLGLVHIDIKPLPKLQTADGERRKRYLYVAIDRASRSVHLAVSDEETEACATAFLQQAVAAFPFRITPVLTDRGRCFTADGFEAACQTLNIEHRTTKPDTPQTNGRVERFNGRIGREVLVLTVSSHRDLERRLHGYNVAYNDPILGFLDRHDGAAIREKLSARSFLAIRFTKLGRSRALVVWAANLSASLPMAVSTARRSLIRRATASGSRGSGMLVRSGVWRSMSWAAASAFKFTEMNPVSPISRPWTLP